ncbi:5'-methylthioadenosine/S-adenosylhomocysteine nucleosidase [soil metagenome]
MNDAKRIEAQQLDPRQHLLRVDRFTILPIMAATLEYGPQLRTRIDPLICGVGPVESAAATAATLATLAQADALPDLIVSLGSAGSRSLEHAGLYQVASVCYRDMDVSPLGFARGITPFADHAAVIDIGLRIDGIAAASIATGASIVSGTGYDAIDADMVDMESFAVLRAAHRFGVPVIGLRGISDGRAALSGLQDWTAYLHLIDAKLAAALDALETQMRDGRFRIPG